MHASKRILSGFAILALPMVLLCGCAGDKRLPVSGNITLDGQPLSLGAITFVPNGDKKSNSSGSSVVDGKYSIPAEKGLMPGKYSVSITPMHKTGRKIPNTMTGIMEEEQFSVNYNEAGRLEAIVEVGKDNILDFAITQMR